MTETFTPKTWVDGNGGGTPIIAAELNRIETGLESMDDRAAILELGVRTPIVVTYAASVTINATQGSLFRITATGGLTIADITGGVEGQRIDLLVKAVGGAQTLTVAGTTLSLSSGGRWWGRLIYDSSDDAWSLDDGSGGTSGASDLTVATQTGTAYTFTAADTDRLILASNAASMTYTIPTNAVVAIAVGKTLQVLRYGAGTLAVANPGTPTINTASSRTARAQFSVVTATKIATDEWLLSGDLT